MPAYEDGDLTFYFYGDTDAPAGAGEGAQDFNAILNSLKPGEKFVDQLFPASHKSLGSLKLRYAEGEEMNIKWLRPNDVAQKLFTADPIFAGPFNEFGVNQGSVGDCWFLAVLADVATVPECIKILIPKDNSEIGFDNGIFHFRFWCRGKWVDVAVDDQLPYCVDDDNISAVFTSPTATGGFWAALLEKAYAKVYGNYGCIDNGFSTDAMKDFTGGFVRNYVKDPKVARDWKAIIMEGKAKKAIMASGTSAKCPEGKLTPPNPDNPGTEGVSVEGIVCGHEYSLLDIQDVQDINDPDKKYTLLKLRNPWGNSTEWNGAFCDSDTIWTTVTPNLRANPDEVRPDGEFWIPLDSWLVYMDDMDICEWSTTYHGELDDDVHVKGCVCYQKSANFPVNNSGASSDAANLKGKFGYYVHLRPLDPDAGEKKEDGFRYNCGLLVNLLYEKYSRCGQDPSIPSMGFLLLWTPGELKPDQDDFFDNIKIFENDVLQAPTGRDSNTVMNLPAGTALILPWLEKTPAEETPYLIRIAAEGKLHIYDP